MSKLACEQKQVCTNVNSEAKRCKGPYTLSAEHNLLVCRLYFLMSRDMKIKLIFYYVKWHWCFKEFNLIYMEV